ncbi:MAG: Dyp-type peroxidase [Tetrasphaera sp.]|jgi:dye decolorizing peroxidase|nr:Dyp-type peroxidase [Tetrasphaera sp.]
MAAAGLTSVTACSTQADVADGAATSADVAQARTGAGGAASGTSADGTPVAGKVCVPGPGTAYRPFRGEHQAGVDDEPQPYVAFVAFTLPDGTDKEALRRLMTVWTDDIERLMSGRGTLTDQEPELAAVTARLTVTLGIGPRVPALAGVQVQAWLAPLPAFPSIDRLDDRWGQGDVLLQICADSPTTVAHAQRRLITSAGELVTVQWIQRGFREPFSGIPSGVPMRNLFGQVDGTVQPDARGVDASLIWAGNEAPDWMRGGSSLVLRRIAMDLEKWDRADRLSRENAIGRRLDSGAPLTGTDLNDTPDLDAVDALGFHRIDEAAHVRRAHGSGVERFLRRPYSYDDPPESGARVNSGLLFAAYCTDPVRQFIPVQRRLAEKDLLNLWTTPIGSAVFAILPGAGDGEILGQRLLA